MSNKRRLAAGSTFILAALMLTSSTSARADYTERVSLGVGVAVLSNPSESAVEIGAEYENRFDPYLGLGASAEYIFSSPGIAYIAAPEAFLHPFGTDFLVSAAPLVEFGSSVGTHFGARLGTRIPIPLGPISLVPLFAVDLISGGPNYIFGLGIEL